MATPLIHYMKGDDNVVVSGRLISTQESYFSSPCSASPSEAVCSSPLNLTPDRNISCFTVYLLFVSRHSTIKITILKLASPPISSLSDISSSFCVEEDWKFLKEGSEVGTVRERKKVSLSLLHYIQLS